jgi:predicted permease
MMPSGHPHRRFFQLPWRSSERIRAEIDEELGFELDMRAAELVRQGLSDSEARRRALAEFGDLEATRRYCAESDIAAQRSEGRREWLSELAQDARLAWRGMRRTPGFALVVLATLALGIGANTAVFSAVRRVVMKPLPYANPEELVRLYGATARNPAAGNLLTPAQVADLRRLPTFSEIAPFGFYSGFTYTGDKRSEMWQGVTVSPEFFPMLGVPALLGRTIDARDVSELPAPVVVLGYRLWQRSFGGDSGIVGRDVLLDGHPYTVIGVMPPTFIFPESSRDPEVWTPLDMRDAFRDPAAARRRPSLRVLARLASGVGPTELRGALDMLSKRERASYPELGKGSIIAAVPLHDDMVGSVSPILLLVMGAALLVLFIACVNVAGLFLWRAIARRRELAVRAALGAGRGRLIRQLLTESAMVGLAGGAMGVAIAYAAKRLMVAGLTTLLPTMGDLSIDTGVLLFAVALSVLCVMAFGILPALVGTGFRLQGSLGESTRTTGGRSSSRLGRALVVAQVALSVVLLVTAGLLGRTLLSLERTGIGLSTGSDRLTFNVALSTPKYSDRARWLEFFDALEQTIGELPTVQSVAMVTVAPWNGYTVGGADSIFAEGLAAGASDFDMASRVTVSANYFATLGIAIRSGREFTARDRNDAPLVAVISEGVARRFWPGRNPIGQQIRLGGRNAASMEVVGVAAQVRERPDGQPMPTVYVPMSQHPVGWTSFVIRTRGDAMSIVPSIRRAMYDLDPAIPLVGARTLEDVFAGMIAGRRLLLVLVSSFALLALLLSALGVYNVMAYNVGARRREFGIRTALGARASSVLSLVLRQGMAMALLGAVIGLVLAAWVTSALAGLFVGVAPRDPLTFLTIALVLLTVSAIACLIPARRATRADPVEALRAE